MYLQVHVISLPAYDVLLGWPFDVLTESVVRNLQTKIRQSQYRTLTQASALQFQQGLGLVKHRNATTHIIMK